jgi:Protein of unknown function (DUF2971)
MTRPLAPISIEAIESRRETLSLIRKPYLEIRKYLRTSPNNYPRFLYKYIPPDICDDWLADYFIDSYFWLSSPIVFNDPFDTSGKIIYEGNVLQKRTRWNSIVKSQAPHLNKKQRELEVTRLMASKSNTLESMQKTTQKNLEKIGLHCLNEDPRSLLMWSHYAKQHKGIVLQFEIAKDPESMLNAMKVDYSDEYPVLNLAQDLQGQFQKIILRKFTDWDYEKEWRLLIINAASTYLKFQSKTLTGVIFGCRADDQLRLRIKKLVSERLEKKLSALKFYNAKMHQSQYKIILERDKNI